MNFFDLIFLLWHFKGSLPTKKNPGYVWAGQPMGWDMTQNACGPSNQYINLKMACWSHMRSWSNFFWCIIMTPRGVYDNRKKTLKNSKNGALGRIFVIFRVIFRPPKVKEAHLKTSILGYEPNQGHPNERNKKNKKMVIFWNEGDIAARKWDILSFPSWTNFINKNFWKPEILFDQKLPNVKWGIHSKFHEYRLKNKKKFL